MAGEVEGPWSLESHDFWKFIVSSVHFVGDNGFFGHFEGILDAVVLGLVVEIVCEDEDEGVADFISWLTVDVFFEIFNKFKRQPELLS